MNVFELAAGDRIYRWVWTGGESHGIAEMTVVRVNRLTVTVDTNAGRIRVPHQDVVGRVDW